MNKTLYLISFTGGVAVGILATRVYFKNYYEKIYKKDVESVKQSFYNDKTAKSVKETVNPNEKKDICSYKSTIEKENYNSYFKTDDSKEADNETKEENLIEEGKEPMNYIDRPYSDLPFVISPDEFDEYDDYEIGSLTYYSDHIVADSNDDIIDNVADVIGFESLTHFGEYEDDSVFVRNDRLKCDYEILLDSRKYSEVVKRKPHEVSE